MKGPPWSARTTPLMVGFTLRKEERDAGGMPGLVAAAGATSTYRNLVV